MLGLKRTGHSILERCVNWARIPVQERDCTKIMTLSVPLIQFSPRSTKDWLMIIQTLI